MSESPGVPYYLDISITTRPTLGQFSFAGFVLFNTRFGALSHSFSARDADAGAG